MRGKCQQSPRREEAPQRGCSRWQAEQGGEGDKQDSCVEADDGSPSEAYIASFTAETRQDPERDRERKLGSPAEKQHLDVGGKQSPEHRVQIHALVGEQQRTECEADREVDEGRTCRKHRKRWHLLATLHAPPAVDDEAEPSQPLEQSGESQGGSPELAVVSGVERFGDRPQD